MVGWTWLVFQSPVLGEFGPVSGPLVALSALVGVPHARLRCALPEALLAGRLPECVGRRDGLSAESAAATRAKRKLVVAASLRRRPSVTETTQLLADHGRTSISSLPPWMSEEEAGEGRQKAAAPARGLGRSNAVARDAAADADVARKERVARLTSSALVHALVAARGLKPRAEAAASAAVTAAHFDAVARRARARRRAAKGLDPDNSGSEGEEAAEEDEECGGAAFARLCACFADLLAEGNLHTRAGWLPKARLWRLVLLQRGDGSRGANADGLAFALRAHPPRRPPPARPPGAPMFWQAWARAVQRYFDNRRRVSLGFPPVPPPDGHRAGPTTSHRAGAPSRAAVCPSPRDEEKAASPRFGASTSAGGFDDPLSFPASEIARSIPHVLLSSAASASEAGRVWATLFGAEALRRLSVCWLHDAGGAESGREELMALAPERTILDAAEARKKIKTAVFFVHSLVP